MRVHCKISSVCNSSSEVKWRGGILWCLNGRACCFLFPVGASQLLVVSEHQWLTLHMCNKGIPCWGHVNKQCVIQQRVVTYISATLMFTSVTGLYTKEIGIVYWCWSRYIQLFKVAVNFLQVTVTIALASSAVNGSQLNSGSDICCTYASGHIFGGLSESFLSLQPSVCTLIPIYIFLPSTWLTVYSVMYV